MRQLIIFLLVSLGLLACTQDVPPPPPVLGPAVLSDAGIEVIEWEYLGSKAMDSLPFVSNTVREVGDHDVYEARLIEQEDGFALVWIQLQCATQPVLIIHLDHALEFWPGENVISVCDAIGVVHTLTVKLGETVPLDEWTFTLHPPPRPES